MKPLRLEFAALGPYVNKTVLDFADLNGASLFLLHGPTGSGKTMLLDAVCFALFGQCSGEVRNPRELRSQHATPEDRTEVRFDFAIGDARYRVWRMPEQERPKRRGTGFITEQAQAEFYRLHEDGRTELLETQPRRVTEEIEQILGFSCAQFRQITVLPQGEFQKFLQARAADREVILEVLFQTSRFKAIEDVLAARNKEAEQESRAKNDQRLNLLRNAGAESDADLEVREHGLEAGAQELNGRLETLRSQHEEAQGALAAGNAANVRLLELTSAEKAYDHLAAHQPAHAQREREMELGRKALDVGAAERESAGRRKEYAERASQFEEAKGQRQAAEIAASQAKAAIERETAREPERTAADRVVHELEQLAGAVEQLAAAKRDAKTAANQLAKADETRSAAHAGVATIGLQIEAGEKEMLRLDPLAAPLERLRVELLQAERKLADSLRLDKLSANARKAKQKAESDAERRVQAERAVAAAKEALEHAEEAWMAGQAALLAQRLEKGEPCPVCGSVAHPAPAVAGGAVPADADLKRRKQNLAAAEIAWQETLRAEHEARIAHAQVTSEAQSVAQALGDTTTAQLRQFVNDLRQAQENAEQAAKTLADLRLQVAGLRTREADARRAGQRADAAWNIAGSAEAAVRALLAEREAKVPERFREGLALEKATAAARSLKNGLKRAFDAAQDGAKRTAVALASCIARVEESESAVGRARAASEAQERVFDAALEKAGFANVAAYVAACRTEDQLKQLDVAIRRFQSDLKSAEDRLRRAREAAAGLKQPDLDELQAAVGIAAQRVENCAREQAQLELSLKNVRGWRKDLRRITAEFEALETRRAVVSRLALAASGRNAYQISFQRFVLASFLDRVLSAATERLRVMSKGRYYMKRAIDSVDRRTAGGLDLDVFDNHTGSTRRVSTLSGGESFLAALSLALGLSDVVQSHTGGVRLDSIFVDEGFGSLDAEALELAMRTLRDLEHGGRLVGIISHVPELKEQIDVRLEVTATRQGSTARFITA